MARIIPQRQLRNDNANVMNAVVAGETFVVTRNGAPIAELRPLTASRRTLLAKADLAVMARAGVRIDRQRFRADLDDAIDQRLST